LLIIGSGEKHGKGGVYAFNRLSGLPAWSFEMAHSLESGISPFDGKLYFATCGFVGSGAELFCLGIDGSLKWSRELPAGAWSKPVVDEARVHIGLDNGQVIGFDCRTGSPITNQLYSLQKGKMWLVRVDDKTLAAVSKSGECMLLQLPGLRPLWTHSSRIKGEITSPPCLARGNLFFGVESGQIVKLDLRTGNSQVFAGGLQGVVCAPAYANNSLWVGAKDHNLHVFDPETGREQIPLTSFEHGITSSPHVWNGLVAVCVNDSGISLLDSQTRELLWSFHEHGGRLFSEPLIHGESVFFGTDRGRIIALPWHLGQFENAANHLSRHKKHHEAGAYYALAGNLNVQPQFRDEYYQKAEQHWTDAGRPEWAALMWKGLAHEQKAAAAYVRAAETQRGRDNRLAAEYYYTASRLYWRLEGQAANVYKYAREAALLQRWPLIRLEEKINPRMTMGVRGQLTFRVSNTGYGPTKDLYFSLSGSLSEPVTCRIDSPLAAESYFDVTLSITQTKPTSSLTIEVEFRSEDQQSKRFNEKLTIGIEADIPPRKIKLENSFIVGSDINIFNNNNQPVEFELINSFIVNAGGAESKK